MYRCSPTVFVAVVRQIYTQRSVESPHNRDRRLIISPRIKNIYFEISDGTFNRQVRTKGLLSHAQRGCRDPPQVHSVEALAFERHSPQLCSLVTMYFLITMTFRIPAGWVRSMRGLPVKHTYLLRMFLCVQPRCEDLVFVPALTFPPLALVLPA